MGHDQFVASNSLGVANRVERRLEAAITVDDGLDANLILPALHSGIIHPKIADRFDIDTSE